MTTKTEEKIKKILEEQNRHHLELINEKISGVFFYGFMVGIIMSYSGFLSYFAGIGTGILISKKYKYISYQITDKATNIFQSIIKFQKDSKTV